MAETPEDMESQIKSAMLSRSSYFQQQSDSLTFEGVRRLLEKDLGLEVHALDSHKRFVKLWLQNCTESASDDKTTKSEGASGEDAVSSGEPANEPEAKKELENPNSGGGDILEDSPVMGLLTGTKKVKADANGAEEKKAAAAPSEASIKKAIWGRASYLRENSQTITLAGLRRLLEEDLELEKHSLDPFKKFVSQQVDEVLNTPESPPKTVIDKKKTVKKAPRGKVPSKTSKEESPTTSGDESDDVSEEVNVRKKAASSAKAQKSVAVKKRKRPEEDTRGAKQKQSKASKSVSEESGDEDGGDASENDNSETSTEKPGKKEVPKPSYGKEVEHLKSVIKSCGLSIPPVIYKKVKQAPENKREACLIKELEELLSKEGLSSNPSEKDIKDVKKRKERARELEGIDMSNIVVSSRRRSATSFAPPPKPVIPDISESESEESEDEDDDEEEGADEEVEDEEAAGEDQEDGSDAGSSEESEKDNSDSE
ncbi:hypothetical protein vseg_004630 [Gypsophila vaccaria]